MPENPDIKAVYDLIQNEFDALDQQMGNHSKRLMAITELPQLARDLYLIHDIVAITCNSGTGAWIHYHHDEPGWIDSAVEAFTRIGYPEVGEGIWRCHAVYLDRGEAMTSQDDAVPSTFIINQEEKIMRALYDYLIARDYVFRNGAD